VASLTIEPPGSPSLANNFVHFVSNAGNATISLNFDRLLAAARTLGFTPTYRHVAPGWNSKP
jgi:hypothetical protein